MTKIIYKYKITPKGTLWIPKDSTILKVHEQHGELCMWVEIEHDFVDKGKFEERFIEIFTTGMPFTEDMGVERKFIDTVFINGGELVFHIYERIN
jgi:hypothetical protein